MNTKHKINFKFLWGIIALCLAIVFSSIIFNFNNKKSINAVMPNFNQNLSENEGFTAVDAHGLIFSIEKVAVAWGDEADGVTQTTKKLTDSSDVVTLAGGGSDKEIYFKPITREGYNRYGRYGVSNGEYVMLNKNSGQQGQIDGGSQDLSETIVISFGQYYFENSSDNSARVLKFAQNGAGENDGTGAEISSLSNITIAYEGSNIASTSGGASQEQQNTFGKIYQRLYSPTSGYCDFAYVLPKDAPEGRYTVSLNYRYGTENYDEPISFSFILIREDAYIAEVEEYENNDKNVYFAKPSLTKGKASAGGAGGELTQGTSERSYTYVLGESKDYPSLTYDYTRYKLEYTHYSYSTTVSYDVSFNFNSLDPELTFTASRLGAANTTDSYSVRYNTEDKNHIVTIMFTDLGEYNFSFNYIYKDNDSIIPNLSVPGLSLSIKGVQDLYSRQQANVQFKYINFAANSEKVDLIVPNGYTDKNQPVANKIYYTTNMGDEKTQTTRVGNTVESYDTNLGQTIKIESVEETSTANAWADLFLSSQEGGDNKANIKAFIQNIHFENLTTNLGSVKFRTNYEIDYSKSFYFKADDPDFVGEIFNGEDLVLAETGDTLKNRTPYNETTFLNNLGYYIIFINIKDGLNEGEGNYYIFAYKYNQDAIKATIKDADEKLLRVDGYSSKDVNISWKKEGVFEQNIVVRYATSTTDATTVSSAEEYVYGDYQTLTYNQAGCTLGSEVREGEYRHYKLEISCEGVSSQIYTFTIDRSAITGVDLYKTEITTNQFGNTVYQYLYQYNPDNPNGDQRVSADVNKNYAITSGTFALDWNAKQSGAKVSAKYVFVPFEIASSVSVEKIDIDNKMELLTNGYTANFANLQVRTFTGSGLRVITRQGIYLFVLTDDAGNQTRFLTVLDNTPAYLGVTSGEKTEYLFGQMKTYSTKTVTYDAGTHKAISLDGFTAPNGEATGDDIYINALKQIILNSYTDVYYNSATNKSRATNLFTSNEGKNYLIVKNNNIFAYDSNNQLDQDSSVNDIEYATREGTITFDDSSAATSTVRTLYIVGENNLGQSLSNSYSIIEINLDNSRGEAYFSNTRINPDNEKEFTDDNPYFLSSQRLQTGSDKDGGIKGISAAQATRDNYVYFSWINGQSDGQTEVEKITYKRYTLNLDEAGESFADNFYYQAGGEVELYNNGKYSNNAAAYNKGKYGYALINAVGGQTLDGLYEITRTYKGNGTEDDGKTLNYYFIVDRNRIISLGDGLGTDISFGLFDNKIKFNSWNATGVTNETLKYIPTNSNQIKTINYPVYLKQDATLKLPATINVPIYKYFKTDDYTAGKVANYPANNLYISVYFVDKFKQLPYNQGGSDNYAKLLFEYNPFTNDNSYIDDSTGMFKIDLTQQPGIDDVLQGRFIHTKGQTGWLTLPGDYVVIISDNVLSSIEDANTQVIGFRISKPGVDAGPKATVTMLNDGQEVTSTSEHVINTNKSNIRITIPVPNDDDTSYSAQTAPDYIVVEQHITEPDRQEIVYTYSYIYGTESNAGNRFVSYSNNGNNSVFDLNCNNLTPGQSVTFKIYLRWASKMQDSEPAFKDSYYYYNGDQMVDYFESVYTIDVDRVAPSTNINQLINDEDKPAYNFYGGDLSRIITDGEIAGNRVKVYQTYDTDNKDASKIYAFRVTPATRFSMEDIQYVYCKALDTDSLSLMDLRLLQSSNLMVDAASRTISHYAELFAGAGYYEIVERDYAGNLTQYVVFYDDQQANYINDLQLEVKSSANQNESFETYTFSSTNSANPNLNTLNLYGDEPIRAIQGAFNISSGVFDRFYGFELSSLDRYGQTLETVNYKTNLTTKFTRDDLATQVVNMFKDEDGQFKYGNYRLDIFTRVGKNTFYINLYRTNNYTIDAQSLVQIVNGNYEIDFSLAKVDEGDQFYYATEIVLMGGDNYITRTFEMRNIDYAYYEVLSVDETTGEKTYSRSPTNYIRNLHGKYILIVTTLGANKSSYPFDTSGSTEFKSVEFAAEYYLDRATNIYYTLGQTNINYNTMVYSIEISYTIANTGNSSAYSYDIGTDTNLQIYYDDVLIIDVTPGNSEQDIAGRVIINPYFKNLVGEKLDVNVRFIYKNNLDVSVVGDTGYHVVIDSRTAIVSLTDADGVANAMSFSYNPADLNSTRYDSIDVANGNLYLRYAPVTEQTVQGINFAYQLYVQENNGELSTIGENNKIFTINPSLDNAGVYRFVITINYVKDGQTNYLGMVVYTFCVEKNTGSYTPFVVQIDGAIIHPNQNVAISLEDITHDLSLTEDEIIDNLADSIIARIHEQKPEAELDKQNIISEIHLPQRIEEVYIKNSPIDVLPYGNYNNFGVYSHEIAGYIFTLYRLDKDGVEYYTATLIAPNTKSFVVVDDSNYVYNGAYIGESYSLTIKNTYYQSFSDKIIPKLNTTFVSVSHYDQLVYTKPIGEYNSGQDIVYSANGNGNAVVTITGSGRFSLSFSDLAGNNNWFSFEGYDVDYDSLLLTLLNNDVAILVNGQAAINKALYNGEVTLSLPSREAYAKVGANINGLELRYRYNNSSSDAIVVPYTTLAQNGNYSYTFTQPGWYSVEILCPFTDSERGMLRAVVEFNIIEPSEAYESYSFGKQRSEQIVRVTNRDNMSAQQISELTNAFKTLLAQNNYKLNYNNIVSPEYIDILGIGEINDRQQFTITYRVDDGIYPAREVSFTISLNNARAIPAIGCSLNAGEGSTKGFTISYNLGEIYKQVGQSGIYVYKNVINDDNNAVLHIEINENSENAMSATKINRRGDADDGNYYIVLKTASGRIVSSYGVKITQPLNTWAIIVIVVVSLIVIAIVVTIILLRTKMRIR